MEIIAPFAVNIHLFHYIQIPNSPISVVVFYGLKVLARHLMAAHPNSSKIWEKTLQNLGQETNAGIGGAGTSSPVLRPSRLGRAGRKRKANGKQN